DEDGSITFSQAQLLANSTDVDGDDLTAANVSAGDNATVTDNGDGTFTVTPDADFNGDIDLSFDVSDGTATVASGVDLTVNPVNDVAVVSDASYTMEEDGTLTITEAQLLANASDVDGDTLSLDSVTYSGTDGVFSDNGDGTYSFAPNEHFHGEVSLSFAVSDGTDITTASATISVEEVNDAPIAGSTSYSISEDGSLTFTEAQLIANSDDVDGEHDLHDVSYAGSDGVFTDNGDGTFSFHPNEHFNGEVSIDVTIVDDDGAYADTVADVTVVAVNDAPVVSGDLAYSVAEDGSITFSQEQLLANASDVDGDSLSATNLSAENATVSDNGDGTFTVSPNADFNGDIAISFDVTDGVETVATAIDLTVNPVNDVAVVADQSFAVDEDGTITITDAQLLAGATDVDDDSLSVADVSYTGTDGVFTDNGDGTYSFAPNDNFNGNVDLAFSVSDGTATTDANIDITVNDINDVPVSGSTSYSVDEDGTLSFSDAQLLANTSDVDGTVTVDSVTYTGTDGVFTDNGDGTYSFAPNENFNGDVSIDVSVVDDDGAVASASAEVEVIPVNDPPVAGGICGSVSEDGTITFTEEQLLASSSDIDGDELTVSSLNYSGTDGVFTNNGDGSFSFSPNENFNGEILFSVTVTDGTATDTTYDSCIMVEDVNDAPAAGSTSYSVDEDGTLTFSDAQLLANSSDVDGTVSVDSVSYSGTDGILTNNGDGTYDFAPNENFNGDVSLDVQVIDDDGATDTTTADLSVIAVNDSPVASGNLAYSVDEDGSITFSQEQLLANASDIDGDDLTAANVSAGDNATVTDNGDGTFTVTPDADFNGDIDLSFDVSDGTATVASGVDLTVNPVNDVAVVSDAAYTINEDGTLSFTDAQLLSGASDIDAGDTLSVDSVSYTGTDGVFTDNGDGTYSFAPNENFNGEVSLSFGVSDGTAVTTADIDVSVTDVNDAPVAGSTSYSVDEDGTLTFSDAQLLANSSDVDGTVSVDSVGYTGTDGILTDNGDGTYSFAPNENFNGDVSLDVQVIDDDGATDTATAEVTVTAVNDTPVVSGNLAYSVDEDGSITFSQEQLLANSSDVDGDDLTAGNVSAGDNATVTYNGDGTFTVTPDADFNGDIDLSFDVSDGTATVASGVDLTVNPVNDVAVVSDAAYTINEDGTLSFTDAQLLSGASDIDAGDTLSVDSVSYTGTDGVFTDNGDGTYSFAPNENFNGEVSLSFGVSDGTAVTTADIDVSVTDVNDAPVAGSTSYSVNEDGTLSFNDAQLLANSSDVDGSVAVDSVTYTGTDGIFVAGDDGTYIFAPNSNFNGDVSFDVTVIDDDGATDTTTADVTVIDVNDAPVAGSTTYSVAEDGTLTFSDAQLLANSSDVDGTVSVDSVGYTGTDGIFTDNGDGTYSFAPNENFNGDVSLDVQVIDDDGATDTATAEVTVTAVNDTPVVSGNLAYSVDEDGSITFSQEQLLANASDIDGDDLTAGNVSAGDNATVTDNGDGTFTVTPDADFNGDIDLSFDVSDGTATVASGVDLTVNPVNDVAVVSDAAYTINEDGTLSFTDAQLLSGASDIDAGDTLSVDSVSYAGTDGVFTDNGDGTYSFAPNENFNGEVSLSFGVSDGTAVTTADIDVSVTDVNDAPVAGSTSYSVDEDGTLSFSDAQLLANSSDVDGTVSVDSVSYSGTDGILTDNGDGTYDFAPNENFNGDVSLDVQVIDDDGATDTTTADVSVIAVNDTPVVSGNLAYSVDEDGSITFSQEQLLANASDIDGDDLTAANVSAGDNATVTDNGDGTFTVTPDADFNGDIDLSFDVSDGTATVASGVDLTVNPVNDVAVVSDAAYTINEDGTLSFTDAQLLSGASDIDAGDTLSVDSVSYTGTDGVFTDNGDGTYSFAPNENFNGEVSLSFGVSDGTAVTAADIAVTVIDVNDAPVAGSTSYSVDEDGTLTFSDAQLLANSSDVDGTVSVDGVSYSGTDGILTDNGDGTYDFAPNDNFNGDVSLDVQVIDDDGATDTATADVTVIDVNDAPVAGSTSYSVDEDGTLTFSDAQLLANSSDVDGTVSVDSVSYSGTEGIFTDNGDGTYDFAPNDNFNGDVSLDVQVIDDDGATDTSTADVSVIAVNDTPVVSGNLAYSVDEDGSITFSQEQLLANASDIDGDDLTAANVSAGDNATVTDNGDGTFTVTPNADFNGDIDLSFDVSDGTATVAGGVDLTVNPVNDVAVVSDAAYTINEDGTLSFTDAQLLSGASDIDAGDTLSVDSVSYTGTDGVFTDNGDGTYSFAPNENFNGEVSLSFGVSDGTAVTTADIDVSVTDVNDAPVAGSTTYSVSEDGTLTFNNTQLLANTSDVDGTVSLVSVLYTGADGIFTDNGDGTFSFAPNENFNGSVELDVTVVDDDGETDTATANVNVIAVNDTPVVSGSLAYSVDEDNSITFSQEQLLANASDVDADELSAINLSAGDNATVNDNGDGTFTVVPDENYFGEVSLTYNVTDGAESVPAQLDLTVNPVDDLTILNTQALSLNEDTSLTFSDADLLQTAINVDGDELSVTDVSYTGTDGIFTNNGDGTYSFVPNEHYHGDPSFSVTVFDGTNSVTTVNTFDVREINDAPTTSDTGETGLEDNSYLINQTDLLSTAADVDGDSLIATLDIFSPLHYAISDEASKENSENWWAAKAQEDQDSADLAQSEADDLLAVIPALQEDVDSLQTQLTNYQAESASLRSQASDVQEQFDITEAEATLDFTQSDIDALTAQASDMQDQLDTADAETTLEFTQSDVDTLVAQAADMQEQFDAAAEAASTLDSLQLDIDTLTAQADTADANAATTAESLAEAELPLTAATDAAQAAQQTADDAQDAANFSQNNYLSSITAHDDAEAYLASLEWTLEVDNASVTYNGDYTYTIQPDENFNGDIGLGYTVFDGRGGSAKAEYTVEFQSVNDTPTADSTSYFLEEEGTLTLSDADLLANSVDVDGTVTIESIVYSGSDGIFTNNGDGTYSFAPNANFTGDVTFDVTVTDDEGATIATTADVTVHAVNDTPVVSGNLAYSVDEDGSITFSQEQLLANASDIDGDDLTAANLSAGDNATVTDNGDGTFTVTPDADFNGDISLSFDVSDGIAAVSSGIDLTVNPVNDAPVVGTGTEDATLVAGDWVMLGDADISNGEGLLVENDYDQGGALLYDRGFDSDEGIRTTFDFQIDPEGGQGGLGVGDGMAVSFHDAALLEASNFEIGSLGNGLGAADLNTDFLTIGFDAYTHDLVEIRDSNDVLITSVDVSGYGGIDHETDMRSVEIEITDDGLLNISMSFDDGNTFVSIINGLDLVANGIDIPESVKMMYSGSTGGAKAEMTIANVEVSSITGTTQSTVAEDASYLISEADLLVNASDVENDVLSVSNFELVDPASGTLTDNGDGTWTFFPAENFNGDAEFSYLVSDGELDTNAPNYVVVVQGVNDEAVVEDQAYSVSEDGTLIFTDAQLLSGATDVEGDTLSVDSVSYTGTDGVFTDNGDGTYSFAPNENFNGEVSLSFGVSDGTAVTTADINVSITDVNDAPVAGATSYTMNEDGTLVLSESQLLANSSDIDGTIEVQSLLYSGNEGVLTINNEDGTYSFAPNENFNGSAEIDVYVIDDDGAIDVATATIDVIAVNDLPVAGTTSYTVNEDGQITLSDAQLLANSSDIEGDVSVDSVSYSGSDGVFTDNGDGTYNFSPNENFNGEVSINVTVVDEEGGTADTAANITTIAINDTPVVSGNLAYSVDEDGSITLSQAQLLANASDIDGDDLTAGNVSAGDNATVTDNGDGTFTVTPEADFNGDINLSFDVSDGTETVSSGVDLTVNPINDVAVVSDQSFAVTEDGTITITDAQLLSGATDIDGDTLSIDSVSYTGTDGVFTDNGDGTYSFAPNENFNGSVELAFSVSDGTSTTDATIDLTVTDVNDAPVVGSTSYSVDEDGTLNFSDAQLLANSSDV
ncbi:tandem-95 repeat protein, partial [Umboniibacter marinipuniceus]|uniref:tandem-95 repeat protein n=1 Tax=Umboniibacter marinipuniceus TaxID=569599 RepID=UPI000EF92A99